MPDKRTPSLFVIESHPTCGLGFLGHRKRALFLLSILSEKQTVDYIFRHGRKQPRLLFFVPGSNADANRILGRDENQCSFLSFFFVLGSNPTSNKFLVTAKRMRFPLFFCSRAKSNLKQILGRHETNAFSSFFCSRRKSKRKMNSWAR